MAKPDLDLVDYMGEIYRRLKLLDSVAEVLERFERTSAEGFQSLDVDGGETCYEKGVLEDIQIILSRYLEARAYVKSLKEEK